MEANATPRTDESADPDGRPVRIRRVDAPGPDATVRHFDELPESAQQFLADLADVEETTVPVPGAIADAFADEPVVVFVGYLSVEVA